MPIVDAHHHFWNPARIPQPWMSAEHAAINRAFEPRDLEPLLLAAGIERTVLVQSACEHRDTDYMLELIDGVDWVGAVVGWVDLTDASARLETLSSQTKLRGIRHLIHTERDSHWILRPSVARGLELLQGAGLVLELPAEFPNHLDDVPELAQRYPELTLVIDHLAKPPLGTRELPRWREQLAAAAAHPNVCAKISGLNTVLPRGDWQAADLEPAVVAALSCFGPDRLLFGSDWPVALLNGSYAEVVTRTIDAIRAVAGSSAERILGGTAAALYRL